MSGPEEALKRIDAANADDPRRAVLDGEEMPFELAHAARMGRWIARLAPEASEALRIAARGQHVRRWTVPRETYPAGRGGYLRWREDMKVFHADTVGKIAAESGCAPGLVERVRSLILKRNIQSDPEAQALEDALCLVFLESQLESFAAKTPDDKLADVVRKTWRKMSPAARDAALSLPLPTPLKAFLEKVLAEK